MGLYEADASTDIREQEDSKVIYISRLYIHIIDDFGYQVLVRKICNGGRISDIFTNSIPNISTLNSK